MLEWKKLLNDNRRKAKHESGNVGSSTRGARAEIERDYDRILFATPTRRLADKTQVFPLDPSDSVRTRLTHSHEVSNLARSIGMVLAFEHAEKVFGTAHEELNVKRSVPAMLAAIGLAHDLGNPPFGHQGECAMRTWFNDVKELNEPNAEPVHQDFINFDGNPQTFRLVTRLQILNDNYGLNLTYGTLAALIKYPSFGDSINRGGYKKYGIFESEKDVMHDVWEETGLCEGVRHPLTHIMEACDDIAYAIIDAEDTVKKGHASFYDLIHHLKHYQDDAVVKEVIDYSVDKNNAYKKEKLSSSELNDLSMQMFRVQAIFVLVREVTQTFVDNVRRMLDLELEPGFELIKKSKAKIFCSALKEFDFRYAFQNKGVLKLELVGHNYITETMNMLWEAIREPKSPFARYACKLISENYRRVHASSRESDDYRDCQLLADSISGMTDGYLVKTYDELRPLFDGIPPISSR